MVAPTETTPEGSRPFHGDVITHRFMRSKSLRFQPHLFCSGSARNKACSSDACYCMNRASACGSWKEHAVVDLQALDPCKLIMARYFTLDDGLSFETCMGFLLVEHRGDAYYLRQTKLCNVTCVWPFRWIMFPKTTSSTCVEVSTEPLFATQVSCCRKLARAGNICAAGCRACWPAWDSSGQPQSSLQWSSVA